MFYIYFLHDLNCYVQLQIAEIDACSNNPCENGGICEAGSETYTCTCPGNFVGTNCEIGMVNILFLLHL